MVKLNLDKVSESSSWDAGLYDRSFGYIQKMALDLIDDLSPKQGECIVDLGCGTGEMAAVIARTGAEVIGVDNDLEMIRLARLKYPTIHFDCTDASDMQFSRKVDAVFSNAALHWIKNPMPVISSVADNLKLGGRFVGEMGGEDNVKVLIASLYDTLNEFGISKDLVVNPWYFPSVKEYSLLLEKGGFDILSIDHFQRVTPLDDCPKGAEDWYEMFAGRFLTNIPESLHGKIIKRASMIASDELLVGGRWFADYTRLRFHAVKQGI
tara:strand:+ start:26623 stop:27420 length:798 start_codon:yes stop_codon:yes gene_type:complete